MDDRTSLDAVPAALAAARPLAAALRAGLIVALFEDPHRLTAVLRVTVEHTAAGAPALIAAASGADAAVLIVHGAPRHSAPLLVALPAAAEQLRSGGVTVAAEVAVRDLGEDPVRWHDLDARAPRDGTTRGPAPRSRAPRWRTRLRCPHTGARSTGSGAEVRS